MQTIDVTPTWEEIMPLLVTVLTNADAPAEAKRNVREELLRLARRVDELNAEVSQGARGL